MTHDLNNRLNFGGLYQSLNSSQLVRAWRLSLSLRMWPVCPSRSNRPMRTGWRGPPSYWTEVPVDGCRVDGFSGSAPGEAWSVRPTHLRSRGNGAQLHLELRNCGMRERSPCHRKCFGTTISYLCSPLRQCYSRLARARCTHSLGNFTIRRTGSPRLVLQQPNVSMLTSAVSLRGPMKSTHFCGTGSNGANRLLLSAAR